MSILVFGVSGVIMKGEMQARLQYLLLFFYILGLSGLEEYP